MTALASEDCESRAGRGGGPARLSRDRGPCPGRASGTSSNRSTSTSPRSVIFSDGITESERNASICTGCGKVTPSARIAAGDLAARVEHLGERPVGEEARRPGAAARRARGRRRRRRGRRRARAGRSAAVSDRARRRRRRRSGCGRRGRRVEPNAPRCSPKPRTKPSPTRPVWRWRSKTAIFARSRAGSATATPSDGRELVLERRR